MKYRDVQHAVGKSRCGLGWRIWAIALSGLIIAACAGTSFELRKFQADQRSRESSGLAIGVRDNQLNFVPASGSHVELRGMSTIGSWTSRSTDVRGRVILDTDANALNALFDGLLHTIPNPGEHIETAAPTLSIRGPSIGDISVPVMSLHGDSVGMDRDMQIALKVGQYPLIEFAFERLQQASSQWDPGTRQTDLKLSIVGKLNMAGNARPIAMDVIVTRDTGGHFHAHAQSAMLMTDFGMTPPGALFGLIKANNNVIVVFDLDLVLVAHSPDTAAAGAPSR